MADGDAGAVRIVTTVLLEARRWRRSVGYDFALRGHIWEHGTTPLAELLQLPDVCQFSASKPPGTQLWRTLKLYVSVAQTPWWDHEGRSFDRRLSVRRIVDLWEGSEERRAIELMCDQDQVRLEFVNEGLAIVHHVRDFERVSWREALEATRGMTRTAWKEELLDIAWQESEAFVPGQPRPRRHKRRNASPPAAPGPFFARRSGSIPSARSPEVAGHPLPRGRRFPSGLPAAYWCSDEPVPNLKTLTRTLAAAFADTGLWPLLWRSEEDPDSYMGGHGNLDAIDDVDVAATLEQMWRQHSFTQPAVEPYTAFPGLAARVAPRTGLGLFDQLDDDEPARLLLVPCNRPADAITMLGGLACEVEPAIISAVLRSWEQRVSATVREVAPSLAILSVPALPTDDAARLTLAAEYFAFCPPEQSEQSTVRKIAQSFSAAGRAGNPMTWRVGWYD